MFVDLGLLALRLTLGAVFLAHGAQKAFGAFSGPGFAGATGFIGSLGFRPARLWAGLAVGGELVAGVLFVAGPRGPAGGGGGPAPHRKSTGPNSGHRTAP